MSTVSEKRIIELSSIKDDLKRLLSICGPIEGFAVLFEKMGGTAAIEDVRNAVGFFRSNGVKLVRLRENCDVQKVFRTVRESGYSAYYAEWALEEPGWTELKTFQRAEARKDTTVRPFHEVLRALEDTAIEARVIRSGANEYLIKVRPESQNKWEDLAELLDPSGMALKHGERYIVTKARREDQRKVFIERSKKKFGLTGCDRTWHSLEVSGALATAAIRPESGLTVYPVFGLRPGFVAYVVEGLSPIDEAELARTPFTTPFGNVLRFGHIETLMQPVSEVEEPEHLADDTSGSESGIGDDADGDGATQNAAGKEEEGTNETNESAAGGGTQNTEESVVTGSDRERRGTKRAASSETGFTPPPKTPPRL
ncbi:hypothetical protein DIPPA_21945 [Diplonema papillatum]|nr:hypothetical protein DIPPA_21945 [Diplonema papillatum]